MFTVERGARGYLLVGLEYLNDIPGAWLSADGVTWELVRDLSEPNRWVTVFDGGAGDEGYVVAGVSTAEDSSSHEYFTWASADGRAWIRSLSPFGEEDPTYRPDPHVAAVGPDWVAALPTRDGGVQFWASADGLNWEAAGAISSGPLSAYEPVFTAVEGLLYFSLEGGGFPSDTVGIWTSVDGHAWQTLDLGTDARLGGIATGAGVIVIGGTEAKDTGTAAGIWVRPTD